MRGAPGYNVHRRRSPNRRALRCDARRDSSSRPSSGSNRRHHSRGVSDRRTRAAAASLAIKAVRFPGPGPPVCVTSQLRLSRAAAGVAVGTSYTWYSLTNVGPAVCSMIGYPGIAILDAHGRFVQHPAVWSTHPGTMPTEPVRPIVLATGQQASSSSPAPTSPRPQAAAPHTAATHCRCTRPTKPRRSEPPTAADSAT